MKSHIDLMARAVSRAAHAGQTDKSGEPYWRHPDRVARAVAYRVYDADVIAAAYLHDVVEDTALTLDDLLDIGFPLRTVAIVDLMTRRNGESHADAVRRAAGDPDARHVKIADVRDNVDPRRLEKLPPETRERLERKYAAALEILGA